MRICYDHHLPAKFHDSSFEEPGRNNVTGVVNVKCVNFRVQHECFDVLKCGVMQVMCDWQGPCLLPIAITCVISSIKCLDSIESSN